MGDGDRVVGFFGVRRRWRSRRDGGERPVQHLADAPGEEALARRRRRREDRRRLPSLRGRRCGFARSIRRPDDEIGIAIIVIAGGLGVTFIHARVLHVSEDVFDEMGREG